MLLSKERLDCYVGLSGSELYSGLDYNITTRVPDGVIHVYLIDYYFPVGSFKTDGSTLDLSFYDIKCLIAAYYELSYRAQYDNILSISLKEDIFSLRNYIYDHYYFKNLELLELFDEFCFEISKKSLTSI